MIQDEPHVIKRGVLVKSTAAAWQIEFDDLNESVWVPKSQCEWHAHNEWCLTEWIAKQKGLL